MIRSYLKSSEDIDSDMIRRNVCDLSRQQTNEVESLDDTLQKISQTILDGDVAREKAVYEELKFIRNDQVIISSFIYLKYSLTRIYHIQNIIFL